MLGFSLFIAAISFSSCTYPLKEAVPYFHSAQQCRRWEALLQTTWTKYQVFSKALADDAGTHSHCHFFLPFQAKDRRDCVKMHGGNSRLSRRWLGAGRELLRSDCRGPPFKHLSTAAVVPARLRLFQRSLAQQSLGPKVSYLRVNPLCMSLCAHVTGECFQSRKYEQLFPVVWGLPYLWTHEGTFENDLQSSFIGRCLFLWVSIFLFVMKSQPRKKRYDQNQHNSFRPSTIKGFGWKSRWIYEVSKKVCFVFWLSSNSVVFTKFVKLFLTYITVYVTDWSIRDRDVLGVVRPDTLLWIQERFDKRLSK